MWAVLSVYSCRGPVRRGRFSRILWAVTVKGQGSRILQVWPGQGVAGGLIYSCVQKLSNSRQASLTYCNVTRRCKFASMLSCTLIGHPCPIIAMYREACQELLSFFPKSYIRPPATPCPGQTCRILLNSPYHHRP